jgi:hypothetical protein
MVHHLFICAYFNQCLYVDFILRAGFCPACSRRQSSAPAAQRKLASYEVAGKIVPQFYQVPQGTLERQLSAVPSGTELFFTRTPATS